MVVAIVLSVALVTLAVMAILAVALIRQVKVLAASLKRFQEETQPVLEEIQRATASAADRGVKLKGSGDRLRR
jgi:predicted PurR-regulated permease PerM